MDADTVKRIMDMGNKEQENIKKNGWIAHYVPAGGDINGLINYHTHGLNKTQNHLNFQIVLNISPNNAHGIMNVIVKKVKEGQKIEEGVDYIWPEFPMPSRFKKFQEKGRDVLRLLIPDKNAIFPGEEGCDPEFSKQLTVFAEN